MHNQVGSSSSSNKGNAVGRGQGGQKAFSRIAPELLWSESIREKKQATLGDNDSVKKIRIFIYWLLRPRPRPASICHQANITIVCTKVFLGKITLCLQNCGIVSF
jgi:hypothetical protein